MVSGDASALRVVYGAGIAVRATLPPMLTRPAPPAALCEPGRLFVGAPDLEAWAEATLLNPNSPVFNADHAHLLDGEAGIVYCWSSWPGRAKGRAIAGLCELYPPGERQWPKARGYASVLDWWADQGGDPDEGPDFIVTLYAPWFAEANDRSALAVLDHELLHCGAQLDEDGEPRYNGEGRPIWRVKPHDVEVHLSEVERYGAYSPELRRLKAALDAPPLVSDADLSVACGTCGRLAA